MASAAFTELAKQKGFTTSGIVSTQARTHHATIQLRKRIAPPINPEAGCVG
jgi:hypothetical protein